MTGFIALMVFLAFGVVSPMAFAGDDQGQKDKKKDTGGQVVIYSDDKKDEKKDKDGK
jgi:hypothetical protein